MKTKTIKRLLLNILLFPVFMSFQVEGDVADAGTEGSEGASVFTTDPSTTVEEGSEGNTPTAEEQATQEAKAEEDRRAALTEEERAAEDQEKEAKAKYDADAPETYEPPTLDEGITLDAEAMEAFIPLAKKLNLSQAKFQEVVDVYAKSILPGMIAKQVEQFNADIEARRSALTTDKEIGGDKFNESKATAERVMNTFLNAEEKTSLIQNYLGRFGDSPELFKMMCRVGKAMGEDTLVVSGSKSTGEVDRAAQFYPKSNMK